MASSQATIPTTCSASASRNLPLDETAEQVSAEEKLALQALKLKMANMAQLGQDQQKLLARKSADDKALRDERRRFREAQLLKITGGQAAPRCPPEDVVGDVNIDSPTTINHHYPTPPQPATRRSPWVVPATAILALIGAAGGAAGVIAMWPKTPTPTATQPAATVPGYDAVYEELQPDGTWKVVKREKLK